MTSFNGHTNGTTNGHHDNPKITNGDTRRVGITVFSGGTAGNSLVDVFNKIVESSNRHLTYVIPVSDNGGSSSELIRFVGGPSVGDIRSRLVRLIPTKQGEEMTALTTLFNHRLPVDTNKARLQWLDIIECRSELWNSVSSPKRDLIRSVLNTLNLEIVKRTRPSNKYDFRGASIGNMFLAGAQIFSGSLESAIYLLSMICSIPRWVDVLPAINSNHMHHISASLENGEVLTGQMVISHPSGPTALPENACEDDAPLPGALAALRKQNIEFSKDEEEDLPARIKRLRYINLYGNPITAQANPKVVEALSRSDTVVYSIGSLYTSIIPSLILPQVAQGLSKPHIKHKILILNSSIDRETGPSSNPMTAVDFIRAITRACEEEPIAKDHEKDVSLKEWAFQDHMARKYVTHLVYLEGDKDKGPRVDREELQRLGITCVGVEPHGYKYCDLGLKKALIGITGSD